MPKTIDIPDLGAVDFPDEMSDDEIAVAAGRLYEKAPVTPSLRPVLSLPSPQPPAAPGAYQQAVAQQAQETRRQAYPFPGDVLPEPPGLSSPFIPLPEAPRFTNQVDIPYGAYPSMLASSLWNKVLKPGGEFVESPLGASAGITATMGPLAARLVSAGFVADMLPETARQWGYRSVVGFPGTPQEKLDAVADLGFQSYVPLHAGYMAGRPGFQADFERQARNFEIQPFSKDVERAATQGGQPQRQLGFRLGDALMDPTIRPLVEQALRETTPAGQLRLPGQGAPAVEQLAKEVYGTGVVAGPEATVGRELFQGQVSFRAPARAGAIPNAGQQAPRLEAPLSEQERLMQQSFVPAEGTAALAAQKGPYGETTKPPVQPSGAQGVEEPSQKIPGLGVKAAQEKSARERGQAGAIWPKGSERRQSELWNKLLEKVKGLGGMTGLPDVVLPLDPERMTERPEGVEARLPGWPIVVRHLNDEQLANIAGNVEEALIDAERSGSPDATDYLHILGRVTNELNRRNLPNPSRPIGGTEEEPKQLGITIPQPEEGWVSAFDRRRKGQEGSFVLPGPELMRTVSGFKKTATVAGQQLLNRVRNLLHPDEFKAYEDSGLRTFLARPRTPDEVAKWMEDNGPKVEVHAYGMEANETKETVEVSNAIHQLESRGYRISRAGGVQGEQLSGGGFNVSKEGVGVFDRLSGDFWKTKVPETDRVLLDKVLSARPEELASGSNPRATSAYEYVSSFDTREPMPDWTKTKSKRNVQRVDVVLPTKYGPTKEGYKAHEAERGILWPPDKQHEQLPNTLGWAMIQYKTGPKGEKMAVVGEVQSRWGQRLREDIETRKANPRKGAGVISHPLLNDYNRLILKAAIDQATKEGATHIVLPDAKTAMMNEGHDLEPATFVKPTADNVRLAKQLLEGNDLHGLYKTDVERVAEGETHEVAYPEKWKPLGFEVSEEISQEGGMRLNYDTVLPKIAEELTGNPPEPVDLGPHKNAFDYENLDTGRRSLQPKEGEGRWVSKQRKDLIFKNPDETPKTSVTGLSYDLSKVKQRTEPFKLFGSNKMTEQKIGGIKIPELGTKGRETGAITIQPLEDAWNKMSALAKSVRVKERAAQLLDAAENAARIFGRQHGNELRVMLPKPIQQDALTFVIGTRGDPKRLANFLTIIGNKSPKATRAIQYAQKNWDELQPAAARAVQMVAVQRFREQNNGVQTINHYEMMYDPRGTGVSSPDFKAAKYYPNMADVIANEKVPPNFNAADLIERRLAIGMKRMNRIKWAEAFGAMKDPATGDPLVKPMIDDPLGNKVAPAGYETREVYGGIRIAVKKEYTDILDSLIQPSAIRSSAGGRLVLNSEATIKHGLLLFDTFHLSRVLQKQAFLTGFKKMGDPLSLLEYNRKTVEMLVASGDMPASALTSYDSLRPRAQLLIKNGLNVGRIAEGLYADVIRRPWVVKGKDINIPSHFNKFVFEKASRSAMLNSAMIEFDRTKANNPTWTDEQVASHVAKQINVYYGNLMRQGLLKSATLRDIAQATLLAPQWFESMAQTELRAYYQTAKVPYDAAFNQALKVGTLAKGVGRGLFAYLAGTQLINFFTRGHPTTDNPEKEHKLDAWIPDPTGKTGGFWLSPFSVPAELTHDWFRYSNVKENQMQVAAQILKNKSSPLERSIQILLTGRDFTGAKILETKDVLKDSAKAVVPTPLPFSGAVSEVPGQGMRQAFSTAGFKVEPSSRQSFLLDKKAQELYKIDFNRLSIPERMDVVQQVEKEPLPLQQRYAIAQRATDKEFQRQADIRKALPSDIQAFVKKHSLTVPAPEPNFIRGGTTVTFNDAEKEELQKRAVHWYVEAFHDLMQDKEFETLSQGMKQKIVDRYLAHAKEGARREVLSGAVH